jgi:hypothetical protein
MTGNGKNAVVPVLIERNVTAVSSKETANVLGGAFAALHRCVMKVRGDVGDS